MRPSRRRARSRTAGSTTLKWCVNGLLAEDLLSDQKQAILRDFLEQPVVLGEIADVLNMRFSNIDSWEWDAGERGSKCSTSSPSTLSKTPSMTK